MVPAVPLVAATFTAQVNEAEPVPPRLSVAVTLTV